MKRDIVIVGAGIAGLACARMLADAGKCFTILTEDVGGRVCFSKDCEVNYGAYFIGKDYINVLPFVIKGKRLHVLRAGLHKKNAFWRLIRHPWQLAKLAAILVRFNRAYKKFKKRCIVVSQKEAIQENSYLFQLYNQKASVYLKDINDIIDIFSDLIYGTMFTDTSHVSAFEFLHFARYLFIPVYEFTLDMQKFTEGFEKSIIFDSVVSIKKTKNGHVLKTRKNRILKADNLILATPAHVSKKLLRIKNIKGVISAYMFHVSGTPRPSWNHESLEGSHGANNIFALAQQKDGTYLVYSKNSKPRFKKYFVKYKIIAKKYWNPAYFMDGNVLLDCKQGKNLYLIGDHNVCGLEDSFITGVYAAKQILQN